MTLTVPGAVDGVDHPEVMLYMQSYAEHEPPLMPRNPMWRPDTAGGAKAIKWLTERYVIGRKFGLANHVLYTLARLCDNGSQIRAMWPVVMHLTDGPAQNQRLQTWTERFSQFKPLRHAPALSPHLKQAIRDTSAVLTSAKLIDPDYEPEMHTHVCISTTGVLPTFFYAAGTTLARL